MKYDEETAQTIISGMGELHLEIVVDRLLREYNLHVNVGKPRVVYRETIQKAVEIEGRFERELGEKKHFGHVKLVLEPLPRGAGIEIKNELPPETIPAEFHHVIEESLGEAVFSGVLAGYPVLDVRIRITGGSFKEGEASPVGYKIATATAFKDGCAKADPVLLEPIMRVDILTPRDFMGEVIGDINARKGEVDSVTPKGPVTEIRAHVPLRSLFRVFDGSALRHPGEGDIHHAVPPLRHGIKQPQASSHKPQGKKIPQFIPLFAKGERGDFFHFLHKPQTTNHFFTRALRESSTLSLEPLSSCVHVSHRIS